MLRRLLLPFVPTFLLACGPSPQPVTPSPAASVESGNAEPTPPPIDYSRFTDPMYLAFQDEKNPYAKRTLARLWALVARLESPADEKHPRRLEAAGALQDAMKAVAEANDRCKAGVHIARDRALTTKQKLEQKYVAASEELGADHKDVAVIDAQVHLLRDELEELNALAAPCESMFED